MTREWGTATLKQVCKEIYRYPSFYGMDKHKRGVPVVRGGHLLENGQISTDWSDYWFVSENYANRFPKTRLELDDLAMSVRGSIGTFSRVGPFHVGAQISPNLIRISPDPKQIEPRFLYYALLGSSAGQFITSTSSSSAVPAIRASDIKIAEIPLPPRPEQRAIAYILGTLDDKIEVNRRMNETLEAMARGLFKSWFIYFDPIRARAEGHDVGLQKRIADLFSDSFEKSELGEIPTGWEVCRVADIGKVICGKTPSTLASEYYGQDVPFITIPDMHGKIFAITTQKRLSDAGAASQAKKMLPVGAICVSCIATPGLVVITSEEAQTNQQINTVVPSTTDESYFWFWSLRNLGNEIRSGGSGGSVLTNLSTGRFAELPVLAPPSRLRSSYHSLVAPLFGRILANEHEAISLAALRDALMPQLISGELRISEAERIIGERT